MFCFIGSKSCRHRTWSWSWSTLESPAQPLLCHAGDRVGLSTLVALNMVDVARANGHEINAARLEAELGVPVLPLVASTGEGSRNCADACSARPPGARLQPAVLLFAFTGIQRRSGGAHRAVAQDLPGVTLPLQAEALLALSDEKFLKLSGAHYPKACTRWCKRAGRVWTPLTLTGAVPPSKPATGASRKSGRGRRRGVSTEADTQRPARSSADPQSVGLLIFVAIMTLMFQTIFTFAEWPMKGLEQGVNWWANWSGCCWDQVA